MNNSPNMPHVKFQPIQTYGYDVIDVCLWRFSVLSKIDIIFTLSFYIDLLDIYSLYVVY